VQKPIEVFSLLIVIAVSGMVVWQASKTNFNKGKQAFFDFYPEDVKELDSLSRQYELKSGLSSYWLARRNSMLSRENLRIHQCYYNLRPNTSHVANLGWYFGPRDGKGPAPEFNFVIPDHLNDSILFQKLGDHIIDTLHEGKETLILTEPFTFDPKSREPVFSE
jgi:hypothetical protein